MPVEAEASRRKKACVAIAFIAMSQVQVFLAMRHWPGVGHDYAYFLPRLLDVHLHYAADGLGVQWWTPSFGCGLPAFANPQHTQFMPAQCLVPWLGPIRAAIVASVMMIAAGGLMVYAGCLRYVRCGSAIALMAGLAFAANGFSLQRLLVGHVSFATFPLIACVPFLLDNGLPRTRAIALFALFWAGLVFAGGYAITVIGGLTVLVLVGGLSLAAPDQFKISECAKRVMFSVLLGAAVAAAKLAAVSSWMQQTPRPGMFFPEGTLIREILTMGMRLGAWEWISILCLLPGRTLEGILQGLFPNQGFWENDQAIALPIWLAIAAACAIRPQPILIVRWRSLLPLGCALWVVGEVALARGPLWAVLHRLPLFSSLHANERFSAALILPIIFFGAWSARRILTRWKPRTLNVICALAISWIFAAEGLRYFVSRTDPYRWHSVNTTERDWGNSRARGELFIPISHVIMGGDTDTFAQHASNLSPYEPVFGYGLPGPAFETRAVAGPILGTPLNFNYPPAFLGRHRSGFSPPPEEQRSNVERLLLRRQPSWPLPISVMIGCIVSVTTMGACFAMIAWSYIGPKAHGKHGPVLGIAESPSTSR
jgi:hypothetical protein